MISTPFLELCTLAACEVLCAKLFHEAAAADFGVLGLAFWSIKLLPGGQKITWIFLVHLVSTVAS